MASVPSGKVGDEYCSECMALLPLHTKRCPQYSRQLATTNALDLCNLNIRDRATAQAQSVSVSVMFSQYGEQARSDATVA